LLDSQVPLLQSMPQPPQLLLSDVVSTQALLQTCSAPEQKH
jgi:hypothetical protein